MNIGIPDSAYNCHNTNAKTKQDNINKMLVEYAGKKDLVNYSASPIKYSPKSQHYDTDGLHFSEAGYKAFGEGLGDIVHSILTKWPEQSFETTEFLSKNYQKCC